MPIQSIDSALEKTIGPHGVADQALADALGRAEGALESLRARHADGGLPLLRLPETHDDLPAIRDAGQPAGAMAPPTSSFSAPAAPASAGRRWRSSPATPCPASARLREPPRLHFIDNLDADTVRDAAGNGCRSRPRASSPSRNPAAPPRR